MNHDSEIKHKNMLACLNILLSKLSTMKLSNIFVNTGTGIFNIGGYEYGAQKWVR